MSLSKQDAENFSQALKAARKKRHLTQEECAELLNLSASYQKDLERMRCIPSLPNFLHICRTLDISVHDLTFQGSPEEDSPYQVLLRLASQCRDRELEILISFARTLLDTYGSKYSPADNSEPGSLS